MKKQGFTLIELMVVIVIMGILAAVAVPKLFGMIAKSKASEIGPAAGTYVKLQDAYVAEAGVYIGNWTMIGYNMPKSQNFNFTGAITSETTKIEGLAKTEGWAASNIAKLNDCPAGKNWIMSVQEAPAGNAAKGSPVKYTPEYDATNGTKCSPLTANFTSIGAVD